jgi:nicotinic acid mononucleotide adenylyltransferase
MQRDKHLDIKKIEEKYKDLAHTFIWIPLNEEASATSARKHIAKRNELLDKRIIKYINENQLYKE